MGGGGGGEAYPPAEGIYHQNPSKILILAAICRPEGGLVPPPIFSVGGAKTRFWSIGTLGF